MVDSMKRCSTVTFLLLIFALPYPVSGQNQLPLEDFQITKLKATTVSKSQETGGVRLTLLIKGRFVYEPTGGDIRFLPIEPWGFSPPALKMRGHNDNARWRGKRKSCFGPGPGACLAGTKGSNKWKIKRKGNRWDFTIKVKNRAGGCCIEPLRVTFGLFDGVIAPKEQDDGVIAVGEQELKPRIRQRGKNKRIAVFP